MHHEERLYGVFYATELCSARMLTVIKSVQDITPGSDGI